jgi:tetratricopeptide (TPR) repeat protein
VEKARNIASNFNDKLYEAFFFYEQGWISINFQRNAVKAREYSERAERIFAELANNDKLDIWGLSQYAHCNVVLGWAYNMLGQNERAVEFLETAINTARQVNDCFGQLIAASTMGHVHRLMFQEEHAMKFYTEALECSQKIGAGFDLIQNIGYQGDIYRDRGFFQSIAGKEKEARENLGIALERYEEGIEAGKRLGLESGIRVLYGRKGNIYRDLGRGDQAMRQLAGECYDRASKIAQKESPIARSHILLDYARREQDAGEREQAARHFNDALDHAREYIGDPRDKLEQEARSAFGLGVALLGGVGIDFARAYKNAEEAFSAASGCCDDWLNDLNGSEKLQNAEALYLKALCLVGLTIADQSGKQDYYRGEAKETFQKAFKTYKAPNTFRDAYRDLQELAGTSENAAKITEHFVAMMRAELARALDESSRA